MIPGVSGLGRARVIKGPGGQSTNQEQILASSNHESGSDLCRYSPSQLLSFVTERKNLPMADGMEIDLVRSRIREYLEDEDWRVRNVGVKLVGLIGYREMTPVLLDMLSDRTPDRLIRRIFGGDFHQVGFIRRNIVQTIGNLGLFGPEIKSALITALKDPYYEVRSSAATTIRKLAVQVGADPEIEGFLLPCLKDGSFEVVMEATLALGNVGGAVSVRPILDLFGHRNWRVRDAALQTVHELIIRDVIRDAELVGKSLDLLFIPCPSFSPHFPLRGALRNLTQDLIRLKQR